MKIELNEILRLKNLRWLLILLFPLFLILPFLTPYVSLASELLIFAIFALGYDICLGYAGMLSFGHSAFFGLGAYGTGIILVNYEWSAIFALLIGVLVGVFSAFPIGYLSIRRRGIYFAMVTLAFGQLLFFISYKWFSLTGGDDGLRGIPRTPIGPINIESEIALYYFILFFLILVTISAVRIVNSPFGKVLEAIRENPGRAESIGFNIQRFKLIAFVISAFFSSLSGGLYCLLLNFVPIETLHWTTSGEVVIMTIIGGMGTLFGPMLGAMAIKFLEDIISTYTEAWALVMGVLFMISVLTFRKGILGELKGKFSQ
jgi:branched-chain amino acid transport system permease protein